GRPVQGRDHVRSWPDLGEGAGRSLPLCLGDDVRSGKHCPHLLHQRLANESRDADASRRYHRENAQRWCGLRPDCAQERARCRRGSCQIHSCREGAGDLAAPRFRCWQSCPMSSTLRLLFAVLFCLAPALVSARTVTDSAGRIIEVPDTIAKVFAAGPPASILLYMLAPEKMTGWPNPPTSEERPFIAPAYRDLAALGRLTGRGGTANLEVVLKVKPDLILDFGSVRDTYLSLADNVQEQTKVPYVLIDGRFEATPAALRLLGDILGLEARGAQLAKYVEETFAAIDKALAQVPQDRRPRVYLARGPDGLETGV